MKVRGTALCAAAVIGLALTAGTSAFAQGAAAGQGAGNRQGRQNQQPILAALRSLNLTDEQKAKITPLTEKFQADTRGLRSLSPQERQPKTAELTRKLRADVEAILTAEQKSKLGEAINRAPFMAALRPLALTPEQQARIDPIIAEAGKEMAKLQAGEPKGRSKQVQALRQATMAKIRPHLTAEQQTRLDQAQQRGRGRRPAAPGA